MIQFSSLKNPIIIILLHDVSKPFFPFGKEIRKSLQLTWELNEVLYMSRQRIAES